MLLFFKKKKSFYFLPNKFFNGNLLKKRFYLFWGKVISLKFIPINWNVKLLNDYLTVDSTVSSVGSSSSLLSSVNLTVVDNKGGSVQALSLHFY